MTFNQFIQGMRPKTLAAAFVPPVVAYSAYLKLYDEHNVFVLVLCLSLALCLQIATNFYNDAVDYLKGADANRVGPDRITTQGEVNHKQVFWVGHFFVFLSICLATPLVLQGGVWYLVLGIISLYLTYGYTGGPYPLAYLGLGELFVFLFFGLAITLGTYFLLAKSIDVLAIIHAVELGLLSSVLIAVNNFRDKDSDKEVGKRTLATRMSEDSYLNLLDFLLFTPYLFVAVTFIFIELSAILPILAIGMAYKVRVLIREDKNYNTALEMSGKHLVFFSLMVVLANIWG